MTKNNINLLIDYYQFLYTLSFLIFSNLWVRFTKKSKFKLFDFDLTDFILFDVLVEFFAGFYFLDLFCDVLVDCFFVLGFLDSNLILHILPINNNNLPTTIKFPNPNIPNHNNPTPNPRLPNQRPIPIQNLPLITMPFPPTIPNNNKLITSHITLPKPIIEVGDEVLLQLAPGCCAEVCVELEAGVEGGAMGAPGLGLVGDEGLDFCGMGRFYAEVG